MLKIAKPKYGVFRNTTIPNIQGMIIEIRGISPRPTLNEIDIEIGKEMSNNTIIGNERCSEVESSA